MFLLTVHNSFLWAGTNHQNKSKYKSRQQNQRLLYDQLTLFNQFDVPFNDDYQAKGDEGENFVLIQYALFCADKVIAKQSCFLNVPLCDFSLLDYGANDVSWEDQKCSELKAVVVDYADQK